MKKKKHYSKPHKSSEQILREMKIISRESRMTTNTSETAMKSLFCWVMYKVEGWNQKRLLKLIEKLCEYEEKWQNGEIEIEDYQKKMLDKLGWSIEYKEYTEDEIRKNKGSYEWFLDKWQIKPQNEINFECTKWMIWFYSSLFDMGYGNIRSERVSEFLNESLNGYRSNKGLITGWRCELMENTGVVIEDPIDPEKKTKGSVMLW